MSDNSKQNFQTHAAGKPVIDNVNIETAGPRGPALLQDIWLIEKLAHFDRAGVFVERGTIVTAEHGANPC